MRDAIDDVEPAKHDDVNDESSTRIKKLRTLEIKNNTLTLAPQVSGGRRRRRRRRRRIQSLSNSAIRTSRWPLCTAGVESASCARQQPLAHAGGNNAQSRRSLDERRLVKVKETKGNFL